MLEPSRIVYIILIVLGGISTLALVYGILSYKRISKITGGNKPDGVADILMRIQEELHILNEEMREHGQMLHNHDMRIKRSIKSNPLIRFNPFKDQGGNMSFAIAITDENQDGIVLSSLYARERMSMFAKTVKNGKPEQELSDEEARALEMARNQNDN